MKQFMTLLTILIFAALGITVWYVGTHQQNTTSSSQTTCSALSVLTPKPKEIVTSPLSVTVIVDNTKPDCHWTVFEAQAGIAELRDSDGNLLGKTILKTTDDWKLQKPVPYNGTIQLTQRPQPGNLSLTIHEENPSQKPNPKEITITLSQ